MLTERWKALLCVTWRENQFSKDGSFQSYPALRQHSSMGPQWISLPWAPGAGPTFFGRACPPFPEKQAASQELSPELRCLGVPQLGFPQLRMPALLESLACLGGWLVLLAHS